MKVKDRVLFSKSINWEALEWFKPENYKSLVNQDLSKLENSLLKNHFIDPFKVWHDEKNNKIFILDGERKKQALLNIKDAGHEIPKTLTAAFIDCKTKNQAAKLVLAYDSIYSKVNNDGLKEFHDLFELDYSETSEFISIPGIDASYFNPAGYDEEVFEKEHPVPRTALTKPGDLFLIDGKHKILCGDSSKPENVDLIMAGEKIKMVFSSPPFNMGQKHYLNYTDRMKSNEFVNFNLKCVENLKKHLDGFLFWHLSYSNKSRYEFIDIFYKIIHEQNLKFLEWVIWDKVQVRNLPNSNKHLSRQAESILAVTTEDEAHFTYSFLGTSQGDKYYFNKKTKRYLPNYWKLNPINSSTEIHKAAFPVKLVTKALELMTAPDDIVIDVFLGTGTTVIAANLLNRVGYGIELDAVYIDMILRRYRSCYPKAKFECLNRKFNFKKLFENE